MALSTAHRRSRAARIDPCYSATRVLPEPDRRAGPPWLYLPGTLEAPTQQGDQHLLYYGRPFGKSLCHAWGFGPAALLPEVLLGVRPLAPGWTRIAVEPQLSGLDWVAARRRRAI